MISQLKQNAVILVAFIGLSTITSSIAKDATTQTNVEPVTLAELKGKWCEYAVSVGLNGDKDTSRPAIWHFNSKSQMSYTYYYSNNSHLKHKEKFHDLELEDNFIKISNKFIGTWKIKSFNNKEMTISGPYGGFGFLKRGDCGD